MGGMDFSAEARLAHAGTERTAGAPLAPPLLATSTYVSQGEPDPERGYGRMANPGWTAVEEALAAIEGPGAVAVSFASGQAASMALMLSLAAGRSRIVFPPDGYYNTRALADRLRPHGAEAVVADQLDLAAVSQALRAAPSVLWAETPTNPLLRVADLSALGELAAAAAAPFVVDNTVATALLQKPLEFGALASMYSLTKAISGHSDVLGGAVVTRDENLARDLRDWRTASARAASLVTTAPPSTSEWPETDLVSEYTDASAPKSSGFCSRPVATVLSTTSGAPAAAASDARAVRSATRNSGLVGVSAHSTAGPARSAPATASRSSRSTATARAPWGRSRPASARVL